MDVAEVVGSHPERFRRVDNVLSHEAGVGKPFDEWTGVPGRRRLLQQCRVARSVHDEQQVDGCAPDVFLLPDLRQPSLQVGVGDVDDASLLQAARARGAHRDFEELVQHLLIDAPPLKFADRPVL